MTLANIIGDKHELENIGETRTCVREPPTSKIFHFGASVSAKMDLEARAKISRFAHRHQLAVRVPGCQACVIEHEGRLRLLARSLVPIIGRSSPKNCGQMDLEKEGDRGI